MAATPFDEDRLQAEIKKLKAETELLELQNKKLQAEVTRSALEYAKLQNETLRSAQEPEKLEAEIAKLNRETFFYPAAVIIGAFAALLGVLKLFGLLK